MINNNLQESIEDIIQAIIVAIPVITERRARLIAETEVSEVIEGARYNVYLGEGAKFKRHLGVNDSKETRYSIEASAQGVVPIEHVYRHQIGDGLRVPLHFSDRSTIVYGFTVSDIQ